MNARVRGLNFYLDLNFRRFKICILQNTSLVHNIFRRANFLHCKRASSSLSGMYEYQMCLKIFLAIEYILIFSN